jgi:hypothetical protein
VNKTVLILLLAIVSNSAVAKWVPLGHTVVAGVDATQYADPATQRRRGNMVKVWTLSDFEKAVGTADSLYMSIAMLEEFDCKEEQMRTLNMVFYSGHMGEGNVIKSWTPNAPEWMQTPPGSWGDGLLKTVCGVPEK